MHVQPLALSCTLDLHERGRPSHMPDSLILVGMHPAQQLTANLAHKNWQIVVTIVCPLDLLGCTSAFSCPLPLTSLPLASVSTVF